MANFKKVKNREYFIFSLFYEGITYNIYIYFLLISTIKAGKKMKLQHETGKRNGK